MTRRRKFLLAGAIATVIALLLALLTPIFIKRQAIRWVDDNTTRVLTIDKIRFNPLNLTVEIAGLQLSGPDGASEFLAFDRLRIALSLRSLYDRALIMRRVTLDGPRLHLVRTGANSYDIDDLLALAKTPDETPPATAETTKPLLYSFNNIELRNGFIEFLDRGLAAPKTHTLSDLNLSVPFIGNIPYVVDLFVTPELRGVINGTPLLFQGKLKPFKDGAETHLEVNLIGLNLVEYASYYPGDLPVQVKNGNLDTALNLIYRVSKNRKPEIIISGDAGLNTLELALANGSPLLKTKTLQITLDPSRPLDNDLRLATLYLLEPELDVVRSRRGDWNLLRLSSDAEAPKPVPNETIATTKHITLKKLRLSGGIVRLVDLLPEQGFRTTLKAISFELDDFSNDSPEPAAMRLKLASAYSESLAITGNFSLQPQIAEGRVELGNIQFKTYTPYLSTWLTKPIAGVLNLGAALHYDDPTGLKVTDVTTAIDGLFLPFGTDEGFRLGHLELSGASADLTARQITIGSCRLERGDLKLSRSETGDWSPLTMLRTTPESPAITPPTPADSAQPYALTLNSLALQDWKFELTDRSVPQTGKIRLHNINIDATDLQWPQTTIGTAKFAVRMGAKGELTVTSSGQATPLRLAGSLRLRQFPLSDFSPYFPPSLNLVLADGSVDGALIYRLKQNESGLGGSVRGGLGIRNLYALDGSDASDLMKWESLQLDKLDLELQPVQVSIDAVSLNGFTSRLNIDRNGQLNFGKAFPTEPSAASEKVKAPDAGTTPPEVKIGSVTLQNGTVEFVDQRMTPSFRTTMLALGGRISGLSSTAESVADVDLRGALDNHSPLRIAGQFNPLSADPYADITLTFNDIELAPITPYSGRYLGYTVNQGKLNLDLRYLLKNQQIESSNRIFIDQFFFGDKVESADATSLPVRLAVALMRDQKGEIHLDIPVTGRSDDPEFRIGSVIWGILKNLVVKAATSPMSLLSSMMGGGEAFSAVQFTSGSATLSESEAQKLSTLAKVLLDRPALKLLVIGHVDPESDPEGYRREELQAKMRRTKFLDLTRRGTLPTGATTETMEILSEERSFWLKETYSKEKFPKPRNFIGLAKELPDAEMEKLILSHIAVGPDELEQLAWARGTVVVEYLVETAALPKERIFQKRSDGKKPVGASDDWRGHTAEFELATD